MAAHGHGQAWPQQHGADGSGGDGAGGGGGMEELSAQHTTATLLRLQEDGLPGAARRTCHTEQASKHLT